MGILFPLKVDNFCSEIPRIVTDYYSFVSPYNPQEIQSSAFYFYLIIFHTLAFTTGTLYSAETSLLFCSAVVSMAYPQM